jgi:hypothetical protein
MDGMGFGSIGKTIADYYAEEERKKNAQADLGRHQKFTSGLKGLLTSRSGRESALQVPAGQPAVAPPEPQAPFGPQAEVRPWQIPMALPPEPQAPAPEAGQPGSHGDQLLNLGDMANIYDMAAQNPSAQNTDILKALTDIISGRDKGAQQSEMLDRRYGLMGDLETQRQGGRTALAGTQHGYRAGEIDQRNSGALKVAEMRTRAAERAAKLREGHKSTNLQDMLDHYTNVLAEAKRDADDIENDVPISDSPDMARMGMDDTYKQNLATWRMQMKAANQEIRQIQSLMGNAMKGGAKPHSAPQPGTAPAPVGKPNDGLGLF